jgi:pimeloyl-ACP methyl ester carboxylesterase
MRLAFPCVFLSLACSVNFSPRVEGATYAEALTDRLGIRAESFEIDGRPAFVLPASGNTSRPQPWILYAPALPDYPDAHERWMHEQFVKHGVAVAGIDVGEAYGSPQGRAAISKLYAELVTNRGFASKPCLFGRSRGGLWVLSWAGENPEKTSGVIGIYPAFDLRTYPGVEKAAPAYGLTVARLQADLPSVNPIEQADKLAKARIPAMFIHGLDDEVVPFKENVGEFAARYRAAGAGDLATVVAIEGQGHNHWAGFFRSQKLVDFAIARAKEGATPIDSPEPRPR